MSEFIISSEQLEQLIEGIEHDTRRKINKVIYNGIELPEIVRCRDCKRFHLNTNGLDCPKLDPDGFCAWGERRDL